MKLLCLSDLHLSTRPAKDKVMRLVNLIDSFEGMIVLNGDIVDLWYNNGLVDVLKTNKPFFDALKKKKNVVWVEGNHDEHITSLSSLNNIKIVPEFSFKHRSKRYVFIHGDKFDPKILKYYLIGKIYNRFCGFIDRLLYIDSSSWFSRNFDKFIGKGQFNASDELSIATLIKEYAKDYDYILAGHYHKPEIRNILVDGKPVVYANSGDWVTHNSYLVIENGNIKVVT